MKLIFTLFLFLISLKIVSHAEGTYSGIYFSDYDENASIYLCNYYSKQTFKNLGFGNTDANTIVNNRRTLYTSISDIDSLSGIGSGDLDKIKKQSHLIDWNVYTDDFGMTLHQTNFLYGLTGAILGLIWFAGFVYLIIREV